MKKKSSIYFFCSLLTVAVFFIPVYAWAQDPGGGPDVPIDGGLSVLLAAGVAYGAKKYRDNKKKDKVEI